MLWPGELEQPDAQSLALGRHVAVLDQIQAQARATPVPYNVSPVFCHISLMMNDQTARLQ